MRVAIVCDWLTNQGGAEKVIESIHEIYPKATFFTTIFNQKNFPKLKNSKVVTSFLQKIPFAKTKYPYLFPLMPKAIESFKLDNFDLVISSSHTVAKAVKTGKNTLHICYCHTPARSLWQSDIDQRGKGLLKKYFIEKLKVWDKKTANRPDFYLTNSQNVKARIEKIYARESVVIYPPVNTDFYQPNSAIKKADFYLFVSRLIPYKRANLAIEVFKKLRLPLKIVGTGPLETKLKQMAQNYPNIEFLDAISDKNLLKLYQQAKGLIFPCEEDFGIVPVEAQSAGLPVIAFNKGGALETIINAKTGIFFDTQSVQSLIAAIKKFEKMKFNPEVTRENALRFSQDKFKKNFRNFVQTTLKKYQPIIKK